MKENKKEGFDTLEVWATNYMFCLPSEYIEFQWYVYQRLWSLDKVEKTPNYIIATTPSQE